MEKQALDRAVLLIEEIQKTGEAMSLPMALVFLLIAKAPGISQSELVQRTGIKKTVVNRYVKILGEGMRKGDGTGLNLIRSERRHDDYREWGLFLTPPGERVIRSIIHYTGG